MSTPAPQVTLLASRGRSAVGELWSANSVDGVTLTVELLDPGIPGASTRRWEALPRATHPALALPLPVETGRGLAVALSPIIGQAPAPTNGDPRKLGALALAYAGALESLHDHGLGHNAIAPSLLCATTAGQPRLAVTAACALPLDVTADLTALRAGLGRLDGRAYEHLAFDHAFAEAVTATQLVEALRGYGTVPPASATNARAPSAPAILPAAPAPAPAQRLVPLAPPNGGPSPARAPGRSRGPLPTRPLLIAGGVAIALIAGTAIAGAVTGAVTGGSHHVPPPPPGRTSQKSTVINPTAHADPTTAVIPVTPSAVAIPPPPAATPPAALPATTPASPAPTPTLTHTPSAHPTRHVTHSPSQPAAPAAAPPSAAPVYVPPPAPVAPAPRRSAEPVVTGIIAPPK